MKNLGGEIAVVKIYWIMCQLKELIETIKTMWKTFSAFLDKLGGWKCTSRKSSL